MLEWPRSVGTNNHRKVANSFVESRGSETRRSGIVEDECKNIPNSVNTSYLFKSRCAHGTLFLGFQRCGPLIWRRGLFWVGLASATARVEWKRKRPNATRASIYSPWRTLRCIVACVFQLILSAFTTQFTTFPRVSSSYRPTRCRPFNFNGSVLNWEPCYDFLQTEHNTASLLVPDPILPN